MSVKSVNTTQIHFGLLSRVGEQELLEPGHVACQGCGATLAMRLALKALGPRTAVVVPACCWTVIDGPFPQHALRVPLFHTAFETAAIAATGIRAALSVRGEEDVTVMAWAGDGGTYDIGLQALSGAAERNEDVLYVVYDNEAYMNTGIQRSGSTPVGAWTTTTPDGARRHVLKKDIVGILAAHRVPYVATVSPAFPEDFVRKFKKARNIRGFRFIQVLSPCPPGWKFSSERTVSLARLAVESLVFPLVEIEDGRRVTVNYRPAQPRPVEDYLNAQGRFRNLSEDLREEIRRQILERFEDFVATHRRTHGTDENIPTSLR